MMNSGYSLADIAAATNNHNDDGWGNGSWWILILFILFGWGDGFGNSNNNKKDLATNGTVQRGFDTEAILTKLDNITSGISDSTYTLSNSINSNFRNTDNQICQLGSQMQQGFNAQNIALLQGQNALATQLASCCCENKEAIMQTNYNIATEECNTRNLMQSNTRDILEQSQRGTQQILDKLCQLEYNALNQEYQKALTENQTLKFQISQTAQNGYIDSIRDSIIANLQVPRPIPAYPVQNPYAASGYYGCCGTNLAA